MLNALYDSPILVVPRINMQTSAMEHLTRWFIKPNSLDKPSKLYRKQQEILLRQVEDISSASSESGIVGARLASRIQKLFNFNNFPIYGESLDNTPGIGLKYNTHNTIKSLLRSLDNLIHFQKTIDESPDFIEPTKKKIAAILEGAFAICLQSPIAGNFRDYVHNLFNRNTDYQVRTSRECKDYRERELQLHGPGDAQRLITFDGKTIQSLIREIGYKKTQLMRDPQSVKTLLPSLSV